MAVTGGDEFDVICIEEAVGQVIEVDDKQYRAYDRAFGGTAYGLSRMV